jgi:hypothetical protein
LFEVLSGFEDIQMRVRELFARVTVHWSFSDWRSLRYDARQLKSLLKRKASKLPTELHIENPELMRLILLATIEKMEAIAAEDEASFVHPGA